MPGGNHTQVKRRPVTGVRRLRPLCLIIFFPLPDGTGCNLCQTGHYCIRNGKTAADIVRGWMDYYHRANIAGYNSAGCGKPPINGSCPADDGAGTVKPRVVILGVGVAGFDDCHCQRVKSS